MGSEGMERTGASCDGVGDGDGALESWEMMDLEASMKKLLASSLVPGYQMVERGQAGIHLSSRAQISSFATPSTSELGRSEAFPQLVDPDGVDSFLREALQGKDRLTILRLEQEVDKFMRNPKLQQLEFQPMPSSYLRLVAHRVVQHYNLQSSVADTSTPDGARIIARKTSDTRFPRIRLADIPISTHSEEKQVLSTQQRFELKRRPNKSSKFGREVNGSTDSSSKLNPTKSVEERKEEYNRARARIFSSGELGGRVDEESLGLESTPVVLDPFSNSSFRFEKKLEPPPEPLMRGELFNASARVGTGKQEREFIALQKGNGRVAIFRDREKDRKDPDYDRNYDRYMQRFDPGFGVSQAPPYGVQAVYSPVVNYNTEFPQLGGPVQPQMCVEGPGHQATPPPPRGPWAGSSSGMTYGHPDSMMGSFNPGHLGSQSAGVYVHPQQYPRPGATMTYVHSQDRFPQSISQPHLQPEGSFSQARRQ
ncbi:hypothetical protein GOP47_0025313 [Adiantum capillus-veneris]|uniref:Uncharacterized protein n=1 Tax=Adiantum capillus-veneris TaxID=13818 RepID=A0A9D4U1Y6_ADICA|nr:hypothetical protein GOP47_0025313 [Adiantum capillus-veneris]